MTRDLHDQAESMRRHIRLRTIASHVLLCTAVAAIVIVLGLWLS